MRRYHRPARTLLHLALIGGCGVMCLPFLVAVTTALKSPKEIYADKPAILPETYRVRNFRAVLTGSNRNLGRFDFGSCLRNSVCVVVLNIIGNVISSSLAAYGFARFESRWNRPLFAAMLSAIMLPPIVVSIPTFVLFVRYFRWYDTLYPLWVPSFFAQNAFFIFLLFEFFRGIPESLIDAARIDGCGELGILVRIFMPLSKPALMVVVVFTFLWTWNDYFTPLLYLESPRNFTLGLGLGEFIAGSQGSAFGTQWNLLMAASVIVAAPVIVLFFVAQRYFVEGVTLSGVKQ